MTLTHKLFSFHGRLRRRDWWLLGLGAGIIYTIIMSVLSAVFAHSTSYVGGVVQLAILLFFNWIGFALGAKRMHDRERSGWWLAIPLILDAALVVVVIVAYLGMAAAGQDQNALVAAIGSAGAIGMVILILLAIVGIWLFIDLGILDGTPGPNRYGPSPKATAGAIASAAQAA